MHEQGKQHQAGCGKHIEAMMRTLYLSINQGVRDSLYEPCDPSDIQVLVQYPHFMSICQVSNPHDKSVLTNGLNNGGAVC